MTQYVRAINIANNSIKAFVFDTNTANTLDTAVVASAVAISANVSAQAVNTFVTLQVQQVANTPPTINTISIANSSYTILDDTAANTSGAYLVITGTNFQSGAIVMVGSSNTALSTTFVDSSTLRAEIPAIAAGTYPVYVVNTNGGTAIRINGLTTSPFPAWSTGATLASQNSAVAFAISLSAPSDSAVTYSNTTALPAGTTLAANGLFSGTVTVGTTTAYSFDVKATDAENQDASRTFSVTVTAPPQLRLYSWGLGTTGILGLNDTTTKSSPTQVGTETNWNTVSGTSNGGRFAAAIKTNGTLWMWGNNNYGSLGVNDRVSRSSPVQVGTLTNWSKATTGSYNTLAIKNDGTLWCWGENGQGQLGLNDRVYRSSPVQIGTGTDWATIPNKTGSNFNFAIKTNGTLWAWGAQGFAGVFGISLQTGYRSSPVQVGTDTNWSKIEVSTTLRAAAGIKTNGTLWLWGNLRYGFSGMNQNSIYRSSPTQVGTGTTWSTIDLGYEHWLATQTNGTLWGCSRNNSWALGIPQSNSVFFSSPVQIGSDTNWSQISTGFRNSWAIKTDGTLWAWGEDSNGSLGFNTNYGDKSSPTQIGTSTWQLVYNNGYRTTFAINRI
jgi:alpha-tubulin suppressor-like RCC1 family protein